MVVHILVVPLMAQVNTQFICKRCIYILVIEILVKLKLMTVGLGYWCLTSLSTIWQQSRDFLMIHRDFQL